MYGSSSIPASSPPAIYLKCIFLLCYLLTTDKLETDQDPEVASYLTRDRDSIASCACQSLFGSRVFTWAWTRPWAAQLALLTSVSSLATTVLVSIWVFPERPKVLCRLTQQVLVKCLHLDSRTELSCKWGGAVGPDSIPRCRNY